MKTKILLTGFLFSSMFLQPVLAEDSPLEEQMEIINDSYKGLRRETDPVKGAAFAREGQDATIKAIVELPEMLVAMPEGVEKAKAVALYRKMMGELIAIFADTELAFHENDMDKVTELVDAMKASKKEGHNRFIEE